MKKLLILTILLLLTGVALGQRSNRKDNAPKVGEKAPLIKVKSLDGKKIFDLAKMKGQTVVLIFGSYT